MNGYGALIRTTGTELVLVDVGASGHSPEIWSGLREFSAYVGFDPDSRDLPAGAEGFRKSLIIPKAVVADDRQTTAHLFLTRSPHCSSTLRPRRDELRNYAFADLFDVVREVDVPATSLNRVVDELKLGTIDWLKTDSQGMDLRIVKSLRAHLLDGLLAVDVEPGLIDAYEGEDLFVDAHRELQSLGFWLSDLVVKGAGRISKGSIEKIRDSVGPGIADGVRGSLRESPGWCEARYLRSIRSLEARRAPERDYVVLWSFALVDHQPGYAMDVAYAFEERFGKNAVAEAMVRGTVAEPDGQTDSLSRARLRSLIPIRIRRAARELLGTTR